VTFESPWLLLAALPLLAYVWWLGRRGYSQLAPWARATSTALRVALLLALLAAVARPAMLRATNRHHAVFVLDVSRSVSGENLWAAMAAIDRLAREAVARPATRISLIAFGRDATLLVREATAWDEWAPEVRDKLHYRDSLTKLYDERTRLISSGEQAGAEAMADLEKRIGEVEQFRDRVAGEFTDVERAVRLAVSSGSPGESRAVYLFTDGHANRGARLDTVAAAAGHGTSIHVVSLEEPAPPEVAASDLILPTNVRVDQTFTGDVRLAASVETEAELRVFADGYLRETRGVRLTAGSNVVRLPPLHFREKGFHRVEVAVTAKQDTEVANNRVSGMVVVPGEARVLYIDRDVDQIPYLKTALEIEGMVVDARSAVGVPQSLSELLSFDALILSNVPADRMSQRQMRMIRTYVEEFGGGFVMLGGDESFGLGGYFRTPIEDILPVRMPIQKDVMRPTLALMLVIDKSGSMEGVKIQLAKRAAVATSEAINPRDVIGVIGFDGESRILLELTPAADRGTISSQIAGLEAGGGTFLFPALEDAHDRLLESNARRKHVIVLSDGQTQGFGYEDLVSSMAADGISLSAVGIGEGADMRLLEGIASVGGGRAYFTNDFHSIPQIFTREALRASKSMLVERLVQVLAVSHDPAIDEIDTDELPVLTGYVATTPRAAANAILVSDTGDPILAKWRFGLGRTAAFTSEPKPRWAEDWIEWEDYAKFWSQLVRSVTGQDLAQAMQVECSHRVEGAGVVLSADVRDEMGDFADDLTVTLSTVGASGRAETLAVARTGPGLYEATLPQIRFGDDQQFVWRVGRKAAADATGTAGDRLVRSAEPAADGESSGTNGPAAAPSESGGTAPGESAEQAVAYGFVYSFSPEFATLGPATDVFDQLRSRGAGEVMACKDARLLPAGAVAKSRTELWPMLLMAALVLAPVDILVRRIG
jgi:Mg-chelatase subunit ChlD